MALHNQSFSTVQGRDYPGSIDAPFRVAETFGPVPYAHDQLDALRMNWRRTPEATYPDGYLGTLNTRRGDRIMDGLKQRMNSRPYTRGIHKGERIDNRDYFWPPEFGPMSGLQNQAETGLRYVSPALGMELEYERHPTDGKVGPRSVPIGSRYQNGGGPNGVTQDPDRAAVLRGQAPPWASGTRGNPGMAVPYPGR